MSDFSEKKEELRCHFLEERQKLSESEVQIKSQLIVDRLLDLSFFKDAEIVHSYVPITKNNEVDTTRLIEHCLESKKRLVVPKMLADGELKHLEIGSFNDLHENNFGVPEPDHGDEISIECLDLIVVPMVAGDHFKNRIGYGKGYYDRFLDKSSAFTIGLLFDCQLSGKELPVEEFDIPLDTLITESQQIE